MADQTRNILLVDSNPKDCASIRNFLKTYRPKWNTVITDGVAAARSLLADRPFDIVVMDYALQDGSAFDLLPHLADIPSMIVTGKGGENIATECLQQGAYEYLVKDAQGSYLEGLPSTMSNVMARKKAELALIQSEARYQDLYDNAPDIYFETSSDGQILSVNRQGASQLGYTVEQLVGSNLMTHIHAEDKTYLKTHIDYVLQDPKDIHRIEFRQITQLSETIFTSTSLSAVQNLAGEATVRLLCRDVTAQKRAEKYTQTLQAKLTRSERMESIGLLAGGVAHDLNNILGPMVAYPDLLLDMLDGHEELIPIIQDIRASGNQAVAIIRDLLTMARQGRAPVSQVILNEVVEDFIKSFMYRDLAHSHPTVKVEIRLAENLSPVSGSAVSLSKILMNLTINAFESMPAGGSLEIKTYRSELKGPRMGYEQIPAGSYAVLTVSDQGVGINEADQEHIFEPFFSNKDLSQSGSGLGLAVVYGVVKDHHGYLDVKSAIDQGTKIAIYLPFSSRAENRAAPEAEMSLSGNESLLVVDDLPEQRSMAEKLLTRLGYAVETSESGTDAVARVMAHHAQNSTHTMAYDLILMDMIMEEHLDGVDAFKEILKIYPKQKCIIVSGYAETARIREAQTLGALQYLPKPYTQEKLGLAVRKALSGE